MATGWIGVALVVTGLLAPVQAQAPKPPARSAIAGEPRKLPARWWRDEAVAKRLRLSRKQTDRINAIFDAFLPPQRARWNAFRPLQQALDELLRKPHADEREAVDLITRVEALRSELNRERLIMLFRIQQVLTPAQRATLQELGWPEVTSRRE